MSSRPIITPKLVVTNGDMSQASITSLVTVIQTQSLVSYGVSWSGTTPIGVVSIQGSNDYALDASGAVSNAGTWNTLPLQQSDGSVSTSMAVSGNTGSLMIDITKTSIFATRLVYTKTSGVGTLQATVVGKAS